MKRTLQIPIDSAKQELGVIELVESHRRLFKSARTEIAAMMEELLPGRTVTRQMIERWFNRTNRVIPSTVLLLAFLTACDLIKTEELNELKKTKKAA